MKKFFIELLKNIFWRHILSFAGIIFIVYSIREANYPIIKYLLLLFMVILSISYFSLSHYYKLDRKNDENKPIIMEFAPWNYSDKDNLIHLFFQSLQRKIDGQEDSG